ncbi:MAG: SRPBCC family protein [Thermoleophilia bacterium]|nr:SRPBCC family protein [Thermoleophilia bacterium]
MAKVEQSIEVNVPVQVAYNQWTQFEDFPQFMEGVESVTQIDDTHLRWVAEIGNQREEWTAEITEQLPDRLIAWRSTGGVQQSGRVQFEPLGTDRTRIEVTFEYEPEGIVQTLGSAVGQDERRVENDLEKFKEFVESRGVPTGAWRGEVHGGQPQ